MRGLRKKRSNRPDEEEGVSMSPLIDAVFLLLIFFLVATMIKKEDKDIDIELPMSTSDQRLLPDDDVIVLGVAADGELFYEGSPTTLHLLHQRLSNAAATSADRRVRLDADRLAPFERVTEVLNALQFRRMNNVGIRTYDPKYNRR